MSIAYVEDQRLAKHPPEERCIDLAIEPQIRPRLRYLDGFRAAAALYVTLFHAYINVTFGEPPLFSRPLQAIVNLLAYGQFGVVAFIVLSGYCLTLSFVRRDRPFTFLNIRSFIHRRARRILPPYYAALLITIALLLLFPASRRISQTAQDLALPAFSSGTLWSHVLLVHNLNPLWAYKINPPMWSLATEWQIYFIFILVLVPIWRSVGIIASVTFATVVGIGLTRYVPQLISVKCSMLGAFGLGMLAAYINFSKTPWARWARENMPWGVFSLIFYALILAVLLLRPAWLRHEITADAAVATACGCLLIHCTKQSSDNLASGRNVSSPLVRLLECRVAVWLGLISYCLYLMHWPVIESLDILATRAEWNVGSVAALTVFVGVPLSNSVAYVLQRIVEAGMNGVAKWV